MPVHGHSKAILERFHDLGQLLLLCMFTASQHTISQRYINAYICLYYNNNYY